MPFVIFFCAPGKSEWLNNIKHVKFRQKNWMGLFLKWVVLIDAWHNVKEDLIRFTRGFKRERSIISKARLNCS